MANPGSKRCTDCGKEKPLEEFPRNRNSSDGRHCHCKPCHNARGRETVKRLYGGSRHYHLRQKYGLSEKEVDALVELQNGICPICLKRRAIQVDHDHSTGRVRGVLCLQCNAAMGAFHDDPALIQKAIDYLERYRA